MATPTYKYKSRIITAISFTLMLLTALTPEAWQSILPGKYWIFIPTLIAILTYLSAQISEEKRVEIAETRVIEKQNEILGQPLNGEYELEGDEN